MVKNNRAARAARIRKFHAHLILDNMKFEYSDRPYKSWIL